jgi:hypothetical protein
MKRILSLLIALVVTATVFAQVENGEFNGAGGVFNPRVYSYTTSTATHTVFLRSSYLKVDRTYVATVITEDGTFYYDPYTVTAK